MILLVATGEKITADGIIVSGSSDIDNSLISGNRYLKKLKLMTMFLQVLLT